jgi:hypothetical protein
MINYTFGLSNSCILFLTYREIKYNLLLIIQDVWETNLSRLLETLDNRHKEHVTDTEKAKKKCDVNRTIGASSIDWAQMSMFYLNTETESSLRDVVLNKKRTMDNVQKHNNCINGPSSQTFRSYDRKF